MFRKHLPYDEETYALLISAYTRAGATEKATNAFEEMQKKVYYYYYYYYLLLCPLLA
jgi:pentatricopeptide repeat protein